MRSGARKEIQAKRYAEERDLVIIGGGVAGYVAAIKAGQAGLKVRLSRPSARRPGSRND